jgi:hypothetical protein
LITNSKTILPISIVLPLSRWNAGDG